MLKLLILKYFLIKIISKAMIVFIRVVTSMKNCISHASGVIHILMYLYVIHRPRSFIFYVAQELHWFPLLART